MQNKKHVFWQAFFLTILFFALGLVFGIYMEQLRADEVNVAFYDSEASLYDSFALSQLLKNPLNSCEDLRTISVSFADKIYNEASELEDLEEANQFTDSLKAIHRKYDLLRTMLWINLLSARENCDNMDVVVYLYVYETEDIEVKAKQVVWERILGDLKKTVGNDVILIPIAVDQQLTSLDYLIEKYYINRFPAVMINEKTVLYEHRTVDQIREYLNQSQKS